MWSWVGRAILCIAVYYFVLGLQSGWYCDGYESHLTIQTNRLHEGNAIGAFVLTNTYIVLQGGGLNDAKYCSTNVGPAFMALLGFFFGGGAFAFFV
jgi:hypothetical protein